MHTLSLLVAAAPIVVILAMLLLRVPSLWAALAGLVVALVGAALRFPVGGEVVAATAAEMGPTLLVVALILLGGVAMAETMERSGAQERLSSWLASAEAGGDRTITLLLLVFGLTPFMESVTGFGLGVVVTAPLLIRMGLTPVKAVVAGLLGLVLVPWGSLAPGTLIAAQLGEQDFTALGVWSAILTLPVLLVSAIVVVAVVVGRPRVAVLGLAAAVVGVAWGTLVLSNRFVGVPLSGVLASGSVIALLLGITGIARGGLPTVGRDLARALVPYLVLVIGILAATAITALTGTRDTLGWTANPALWLLVAAATSFAGLGGSRGETLGLLRRVVRRWAPIAGNAVAFMLVGIVMAATGMATDLAVTASHIGPAFVALIPLVGALGGYVTGSNTGAAAMFSAATASAANGLGANALVAVAGQNVAGSYAMLASPPRVALAVGVALPAGERLPAWVPCVLLGAVLVAVVVLGALVAVFA